MLSPGFRSPSPVHILLYPTTSGTQTPHLTLPRRYPPTNHFSIPDPYLLNKPCPTQPRCSPPYPFFFTSSSPPPPWRKTVLQPQSPTQAGTAASPSAPATTTAP